MKRFGIILFLMPVLLEIIYPKQFIIEIPGLPYSLGQFTFILTGIMGLKEVRINALGQVSKAFSLIYVGMFFASFINGNIQEDLSKSLGTIIQFVAAVGWSMLLLKKRYLNWLDILMISMFIYWMFYVLGVSISGGSVVSYSQAFQDDRAVNHHVPGMAISTSAFYLLFRFFCGENKFKLLGFVLLGVTISTMLLLESRSNLLVCILLSLISYSWIKKGRSLNLWKWVPVVLLGYFLINFMINRFEFIEERFALDLGYQQQTTIGRREVYARFLYEFAQNPLGRGPNDYKYDLGTVTINAHNTYLTLIIIGGILAFFGVIVFLIKSIKMGIKGKWFRKRMYDNQPKQIYSGYLASIVFFTTLFTIEQGNLLFYICLSIMLTTEYIYDKSTKFKLVSD